jgi:entericidin B
MRILFLTAAMAFTVSACNTMEGVGQDMKVGGEKLERAADENKGPDSRKY